MLVLCEDEVGRWTDVRVEDACSILAQVPEPPTQLQMSCLTFRVPVTTQPILIVVELPLSACLVAADESVLQFAADILRCFPFKPVRRAAFESDSESDDDDETDRLTKKPKKSLGTKDDVDVSRIPGDDYFAAWNASDVQLVSGDDVAASLAPLSLPHHVIAPHVTSKHAYIVAVLPPSSTSIEGVPNVGFLTTHPVVAPGFLTAIVQTCVDEDGTTVMWKQSVLSFNGCQELSEHGAGKTPPEMLDNIRRRHASGTFTKLVLPAMTWIDVVSKYATTFPWIRGIQGDLRMRKIMEVILADPVSIRLHVV
ncbi:hypothetical protein H257_00512 [Aphanomyces astaci]|uniref:Uncharacterized protein n=1 Tax=Aphanomyces astaci TaxID=112090 RepID=W4HAV0_APHAT|nr:hypothetical protein H257_00512 [Aphanomyces astaci]ETV89140.1 hypothetical protein H257_00512 [Aphanomyces astaci]|eukprot:XP_009821540.1 hypothetical protein H257_00512 [Aphanomyces astaci]